jgi:predicted MFS family arabinose efflux permease
MGATAQGILAAVSSGLASSCGAVVGGLLYDSVGTAWAFRFAGAGAVVTLAFFLLVGGGRINPGGDGGKRPLVDG